MATASKKKTFPQKLWQLLNDYQLESAIRWSDDGHSFFVYEKQLRNLCLGKENKVFFTRKPKSFIRQLHLYGFRKLNKNQFKHPNFARDKPHLIQYIKRSYRNINPEQPSGSGEDELVTTRYVITYLDQSGNSFNDSCNETLASTSYNETGYTDYQYSYNNYHNENNYNYNYGYYPTYNDMDDLAYANVQQPTSSSISSLCVCPGCCTL